MNEGEKNLVSVKVNEKFSIYSENALEKYRAESFLTKEPETIEWIKNFFKEGDILFDIGANIGIYSLYAASLFPEMKVFAFEPFRKNFFRLCQNIDLNRFKNVYPMLFAVGEKSKLETLYIPDVRSGGSGSQVGEAKDDWGKDFNPLAEEKLLVVSLDEMIQKFNMPVPNHVKIDVDGLEKLILEGMEKLLAEKELKSVLIEVNRQSLDIKEVVSLFDENGFTTDNPFNKLENHSRNRRRGTRTESAENIIFCRK